MRSASLLLSTPCSFLLVDGPDISSFRWKHFLRIIQIFLMNSLDFCQILRPLCQLLRLLLDDILFIAMMRGALSYPQCDNLT